MENKRQKCINRIFFVMIIVVFSYFILGEFLLPSDQLGLQYRYTEYTGKWERVMPSGERETVQVPGKCRAKRNELVVLETRLPSSVADSQYLCFRSGKQEMKFYVDGELRQEYSTKGSRLFGKLSAVAYVFFEVHAEDVGKVLRVETQTDSSYTGMFYTVYAGSPMGVWSYLFQRYGAELIVAFVALILSMIAIFGGMALRISYRAKVALEYLGWGSLVAAVWLITNSVFRQILFPNLSVINDITFLMIMLLAIPYLLYLDEIQKGRYRKIYQILEGIVIVNFFVCVFLHITKICDYTDTVSYVSVFCIISILLMLATILIDLKKGRVREYPFVAIGMFGVCVAAFIQIILYFQKNSMFNGLILAIGLIFLLTCCTISTIQEIRDMNRDKETALRASESKGRFLANMSHEIRTPIHAVLGMDAMILRESREAKIREYALDIQNAGQSLLSLINDILDISKIESGKMEVLSVEYDFSSLIHDVVNMMKMKAQDKELEFYLSVEEMIPSRLLGDDVRLRQILINLMNNAVKYTEQGSVTLRVSMEQQEDAVALTFRVEDTGIGIRQEDMEKLFLEFERIEETRNRKVEGTGLGMSITTHLLALMDSKLEVESVYGEGSAFWFTVKQQVVNSEPIGDLEKRIRNQAVKYSYRVLFTAPEANVLLVDDNAVNRRVFLNLLRATKMQVDEAASGEECLECVQNKEYDLIFMDHMMPGMDGIQTLHRMREWEDYPCKATPVIALTANAVTGAREMYLEEGFQDFLSKPVKPEKMEKMIMEMLPKEKVHLPEEEPEELLEPEEAQDDGEEQELPEIEGIDWQYAQLYCPDSEILLDTVCQFYDMAEREAVRLTEAFEQLTQNLAAEAFRSYRVQVHSMKNSAAMIGAVSLSGVAKMLEYAARDQSIHEIAALTPCFLREWRTLQERLSVLAAKTEQGTKEPDYEMIRMFLEKIRTAIEEMDIDTADAIVQQLKQFSFPKNAMTEAVENIALAVTDIDEEQTKLWSTGLEKEIERWEELH